jgi:hypothetical protein
MAEAALRARIAELETVLREIGESVSASMIASPWRELDRLTSLARAALSRAVPEPPTPPPHLREPVSYVWTAERVALLSRCAGLNKSYVLAKLNDLPGVPIASEEAVELRWKELCRGAA